MGAVTKISPDFKIEIPEEVRNRKGWAPGQELVFLPKGDGFVLVPVPDRKELFGIARGANTENYRDRNDRY